MSKHQTKETEKYGFKTIRKVSLLKAEPEDLDIIVRMYNPKSRDYKLVRENWRMSLQKEVGDYNNFTFIVRDRCSKPIGLVAFETKDKMEFNIDVWIPSFGKREEYLQHVVDSLIEWVADYTDIWRFTLRVMKGNPKNNQYDVLLENYEAA